MDEPGSSKRGADSRESLNDGGLREIVERATHPEQETPEPRVRRRPPSHVLRTLIGIALYVAGLGGFGVGLVHLLHIGSCGSGSSAFVSGPQCPGGTGWYVGLLIGGIFASLIGAAIAGIGIGLSPGIGFTVIGAAALYDGLTTPESAQTAATGYAMGALFIVMGLVCLVFTIWFRRSVPSDAEPALSAAGLSRLIAATVPKPLPSKEHTNDQEQKGEGG